MSGRMAFADHEGASSRKYAKRTMQGWAAGKGAEDARVGRSGRRPVQRVEAASGRSAPRALWGGKPQERGGDGVLAHARTVEERDPD